jgi:hypothetical protein
VAVTTLFLAPLSLHPGKSVVQNADVYGNAWTLAFVVHRAVTDPLRLFEANIYHPIPGALGLTETQFPQALLAAPWLLNGGSAILAHNMVVVLSFILCGLAMYVLARDLTGSQAGAAIAAVSYAFCAYRLHHLVHVQSLAMQWLPAALFAIRRAVHEKSLRWSIAASCLFLFALLGSGYYVLITIFAVAILLLNERGWRRPPPHLVAGLAIALGIALLSYLPMRAALQRESATRGAPIARTEAETSHWSARWSSFFDPGGYVALPHQAWLAGKVASNEPLFPTTIVLALTILGAPLWLRNRRVRWAAVLLAAGILLSLGPSVSIGGATVPGPFNLLRLLPGGALLRTPARLGVLALLGFALLAAASWAALERRIPRAQLWSALAIAAVIAETYPVGLARSVASLAQPPSTAQWLATAPIGPVLELPWDHETADYGATYIYWSTYHWQPMVNGWGAFEPRGPFGYGVLGKLFPSDFTAREFRRGGIRYVVVHTDLIPPDRPGRLMRATGTIRLPPGVRLAASMGPHRIYELDPPN